MKKISKPAGLPDQTICVGIDTEDTRDFLNRIADKWSILIVVVLSKSPKRRARFSELQKNLLGISQTMLTSTLRSLERDGLVTREVFPEVPPRVEYELTELGERLMIPMGDLVAWVSGNWTDVKRARDRFDKKRPPAK
jgi:DNA-binding HxlR family transcriptional regulator